MNSKRTLLRRFASETGVLRRAESAVLVGTLPWNRFGVRDPTLLMSPEGLPIADEQGHFTLFFNARDRAIKDGGITRIGRATGRVETGWTIDPDPALTDGAYAAQGSVIQLAPDHYRLYYSPDTAQGLAMASSCDGKSWHKSSDDLILTPNPFGVRRMGLPFVRRVLDRWVMLFEGIDKDAFHIYLATSTDGVRWHPGNEGKSIYSPASDAWDRHGQANPTLYVECDVEGRSTYYILYNGCRADSEWDIGILSAGSLQGPWVASAAPILSRGHRGQWDAGRVEGARLFQHAAQAPMLMYFGLPTTDSYFGGGIAFADVVPATDAETESAVDAGVNSLAERSFNDRLAERYFDIWDHYPIQRFTTAVESRLMNEVIPPRSRVVLLGSGGGREMSALLNLGCSITAVDISPGMLAAGRARYADVSADIDWVEADLHELPSSLVDFDAAICVGAVFNYLRDPALFLDNTRRCLKTGGALILSVINARHASESEAEAQLSDGRVRNLYSLADVKTLLSRAGFGITGTTGVRFYVDLLPAEWNRHSRDTSKQAQALNSMLETEAILSECLPADRAKFMLIHARARGGFPGLGRLLSTVRAVRRGSSAT